MVVFRATLDWVCEIGHMEWSLVVLEFLRPDVLLLYAEFCNVARISIFR